MVAIVALIGLTVSLFIFVWPGAGANLAERASISTGIASVFALIAATVGISLGIWLGSSDHAAQQAVKADTARFRATVRSIIIKGGVLDQEPGRAYRAERDALNAFQLSTTAMGYWAYAEHRSEAAGKGVVEDWRLFFTNVAKLVHACEHGNRNEVLSLAVELEALHSRLDRTDINEIGSQMADLAGVLGTAAESKDPLLSSILAVWGKPDSAGTDADPTHMAIRHLKRKGVNDPNVDLFVAVFDDDPVSLKAALEAGADPNITDKQVLAAHKAELADFEPSSVTSRSTEEQMSRYAGMRLVMSRDAIPAAAIAAATLTAAYLLGAMSPAFRSPIVLVGIPVAAVAGWLYRREFRAGGWWTLALVAVLVVVLILYLVWPSFIGAPIR